MTIQKDKTINIPIWLVSIVLPLLIAVFSSYVINETRYQDIKTKTEIYNEDIKTIKSNKVERMEFEILKQQLNRIEDKLDKKLYK